MTIAEFKDVFAKLRKEKDLSQEEMAKQLEVSKATIGMWETGQRLPRNETYEQIADYFNTTRGTVPRCTKEIVIRVCT